MDIEIRPEGRAELAAYASVPVSFRVESVLEVRDSGVHFALTERRIRAPHHALGVISFDSRSGTYTLRSYLSSGQSGDFALTLVEGGVSWTREVPGGRIRNTAWYGANEWHEIGEFSRDGTTWTQVMELRLQREP